MSINERPMTKGGVTIGNIEKIRVTPLKRLVILTENSEKQSPKKVDDMPTATASIKEFVSVRPTPKDVILLKNAIGVNVPSSKNSTFEKIVEIG